MNKLILIFAMGLVGVSYPMKGEVTTPALSLFSHKINLVTKMQEEIWKEINGYDKYMISSLGRVLSKHRGERILKPNITKKEKYALIVLCNKGYKKSMRIHRLVAEAFIPNPDNKPQVNHKNSIRHYNVVENLEWCFPSENVLHGFKYGNATPYSHWKDKFGEKHHASKTILCLNDAGEVISEHVGIAEAARTLNIQAASISMCCRGIKKHAGGYVWQYKNKIV